MEKKKGEMIKKLTKERRDKIKQDPVYIRYNKVLEKKQVTIEEKKKLLEKKREMEELKECIFKPKINTDYKSRNVSRKPISQISGKSLIRRNRTPKKDNNQLGASFNGSRSRVGSVKGARSGYLRSYQNSISNAPSPKNEKNLPTFSSNFLIGSKNSIKNNKSRTPKRSIGGKESYGRLGKSRKFRNSTNSKINREKRG